MNPAAEHALDYVKAIAPYQPGKPISELARELELDEANIVKLASNENPLGISPLAKQAIEKCLNDLALYPDGNGFALKQAIAQKLSVGMDQIVLGNGSNDVLDLVARAYLAQGADSVYSQHAFAVYPLAVQACGARGIEVPAVNFGHDLAAMRAAITPATRVVWVANPNNPTGTLLPAAELHAFIASVPQDVVVVLDEAYGEYLTDAQRADSVAWLQEFPNLVITRTFSKAYGLAGLRVGYALAQAEVAGMLNRVREPFNVNSLAQAAAVAALSDTDFIRQSAELNRAGMAQLEAGFKQLGLDYIPSFGNFICVRIGNATAMYRRLLELGVIVRPVGNYGMPEYLRVSIGTEKENSIFLTALQKALSEQVN